jgi:hypothetical protein
MHRNLKEVSMGQVNRYLVFIPVIALAVILQLVFIAADNRDSATRAALEFTKSYFMLDPGMSNRLCNELANPDGEDPVATYLYQARHEGQLRGLPPSIIRSTLDHVETTTLKQDDASAVIHISATRRACINPVFAWVARLFRLGKTYHVDEELELVKENGSWKVCGKPFALGAKG